MSPTLLSTLTDAGLDEVRPWPSRPLASVSPLLSCEALCVQSREAGAVQPQAVSLALGVTRDGAKALLGWWLRESEGATCGLSVCTELPNRGVTDGLMACVDGLQGRPEAIEAVVPKTQGQLGLVHKVRNRLTDVPWKERRAVAAALRALEGAATLPDAEHALERCAECWDAQYPAISPSGLADGDRLTVLCDDPPALRRAIETTHAIESWHSSLRKVRKGRGAFPNDEAIVKLLDRGLQQVAKKWTQPIPEWKAALNQFVILFGERVQV